jgi:Tfp pilus assembly protein PilF
VRNGRFGLYCAIGVAILGGCTGSQNLTRLEVRPVVSVRHGTDQSQGYYELGRYYLAQNRPDVALDALNKALVLDARFVEAHNAVGVIYSAQGNYDSALAHFRTAIELAPDAAYLQNNLGYTLYLQGNGVAAVSALEHATTLEPSNSGAWNNLSLALAQAGESAQSVAAHARALLLAEPPPLVARAATKFDSAGAPANPVVAHPAATGKLPAIIRLTSDDSIVVAPAEPTEPARMVAIAPNVYELRWAMAPDVVESVRKRSRPASAERPYGLEVSNGNGVSGMARRIGQQLAANGSPKAWLTNQKPFEQRSTEIQYREGYVEPAMALRGRVPGVPPTVRSTALRPGIDVRLVLGKDLPPDVALLDPATTTMRVASTPSAISRETR